MPRAPCRPSSSLTGQHHTIQSLLGAVRVATEAKGIALHIKLDPAIDALSASDDPLWIVGDAVRLRQVGASST